MTKQEFTARTGIYPTGSLYAHIEGAYMAQDLDKDAFCRAYKANEHGLAESIAKAAALAEYKADEAHKQALEAMQTQIDTLRSTIDRLTQKLDREQEWTPWTDPNAVPESAYKELVESVKYGSARFLDNEEALALVCNEFGFDPHKVTILHTMPTYQVNRHHQLRKVGERDCRAVYCATDYNYVRFCVSGQLYECWGGDLRFA